MRILVILFAFTLICSAKVFAQDTLITTTEDTLIVKVQEISPTEIVYKKYNNLNGPTYRVYKYNVSQIKYPTGDVETYGESSQMPAPQAQEVYRPAPTVAQQKEPEAKFEPQFFELEKTSVPYRFIHDGRYISQYQALRLLEETNQPAFGEYIKRIKKYQRIKSIAGYLQFANIPLGIAALYLSETNLTPTPMVVPLMYSGGMVALRLTAKNNWYKELAKAADAYNEYVIHKNTEAKTAWDAKNKK